MVLQLFEITAIFKELALQKACTIVSFLVFPLYSGGYVEIRKGSIFLN
jgi:hypothetical protein